MSSFDFPKYGTQQITGNRGEIFFENFVTKNLGFIYRKVHRENDFGIDGYIDIVDTYKVTGRSIAVQIKCGDSYIAKVSDGGIRYVGENKHLNFMMNLEHPVILVIIDTNCSIGYWAVFSPSTTNPSERGWWIEIPKSNLLTDESLLPKIKSEWMGIAGVAEDYTEKLKGSWELNSALDKASINMCVLHRDEIEKNDFTGLNDFIERSCRTKELSIKNRNKLSLVIAGYDNDPRELYEIPEVRAWFQKSIDKCIPWFYLLKSAQDRVNLEILLYSCCPISISNHSAHSKIITIEDYHYINQWIDINFHNLNRFIDSRDIPEDINEEISKHVAEFFHRLKNK